MALALLDSTVVIDILRGRPAVDRVRRLRSRGDLPTTSAICVEEVVRGLRPLEGPRFALLLEGLRVIAVSERAAWQAGEWRREHAGRGTTLTQADCLIAAAAWEHDARLCTGNRRHFPMAGLDVEDWPAGA